MKAIIRDVLKWMAVRHPELARQIDLLQMKSQTYTGCGLYTDFKPLPEATASITLPSPVHGPEIEGPGIEFGACSLIWLKQGMVTQVEVAAYGDSFPEEPSEYRLTERVENPPSQGMPRQARNLERHRSVDEEEDGQ